MHCPFVTPKLVILFPVRVCSWFASSDVCANANLIVITPKEQTKAESIVYSARTVIQSSSFTKPGFKNQTAPEQPVTSTNEWMLRTTNELKYESTASYIRAQQMHVCVDGTANLLCASRKWFPYCSPRIKICQFFVWTQRELDAPGVLSMHRVSFAHLRFVEN